MEKSQAKDYLLEYVESGVDGWLKELIFRSISTNGNIQDIDLEHIYELLINGNDSTLKAPIEISEIVDKKLILNSINHISGVGAIDKNQEINFSSRLTFIYGLNGTGKSSYFRILNEVCGGNVEYNIEKNIYNEVFVPINVKLNYSLGDKIETLDIGENYKENRGKEPFNNIRVFDSSYAKNIIEPHDADKAIIYPYGLHIFKYISDTIDSLKKKLQEEILELTAKLPIIDTTEFSPENKECIINHDKKKIFQKNIESQYDYTEDEGKKIDKLVDEKCSLEKEDPSSRIELLENEKENLENFKKTIIEKGKYIQDIKSKIVEEIGCYINYSNDNNEAKKKYEILNEIDIKDSKIWKTFIENGVKYTQDIGANNNKCPYCNQELTEHAICLINAYSKFLKDKTEVPLKAVISTLQQITHQLLKNKGEIKIPENLKTLSSDEKMCDDVEGFSKQYNQNIDNLIDAVKNRVANTELIASSRAIGIIQKLTETIKDREVNISKLKQTLGEKKERIEIIQSELSKLKEKRAIYNQKDLLKKWFDILLNIEKLNKRSSRVTTRNISTLSKSAFDNLLTKELCDKFKYELDEIGFKNLDVKLEVSSIKKGSARLQLKLVDKSQMENILSEGENKGVALALFIAEIKSRKNNYPIVFDDPVNSLDHRIIEKFAKILKEIPNQIVIFSHNILFRESLVSWKDCKSIELHSLSKSKKGEVKEYVKETYGFLISQAKEKLKKMDAIDEITIKLREAIEHIIDEVILGNAKPTRFAMDDSIMWDSLKKAKGNNFDIDSLKECYREVSHRKLHNGMATSENTLDYEDLDSIITKLQKLVGMH